MDTFYMDTFYMDTFYMDKFYMDTFYMDTFSSSYTLLYLCCTDLLYLCCTDLLYLCFTDLLYLCCTDLFLNIKYCFFILVITLYYSTVKGNAQFSVLHDNVSFFVLQHFFHLTPNRLYFICTALRLILITQENILFLLLHNLTSN